MFEVEGDTTDGRQASGRQASQNFETVKTTLHRQVSTYDFLKQLASRTPTNPLQGAFLTIINCHICRSRPHHAAIAPCSTGSILSRLFGSSALVLIACSAPRHSSVDAPPTDALRDILDKQARFSTSGIPDSQQQEQERRETGTHGLHLWMMHCISVTTGLSPSQYEVIHNSSGRRASSPNILVPSRLYLANFRHYHAQSANRSTSLGPISSGERFVPPRPDSMYIFRLLVTVQTQFLKSPLEW